MSKLFFACKIDDANARQRIEKLGTIVEAPEADSPEKIRDAAQGAEVIVVPYTAHTLIDKTVIDGVKGLKLVASTYGGVRQNIDDIYTIEKDVCLIHTGPTRVRPMAEYTLAMTLSALTQFANYHHYMKSGEAWPRMKFGRTRILHRRKVGVIGYGLIGKGIADLFKAFTDDITIYSEHSDSKKLERDGFKKAASLESVFAECEVIILAGGYNPKTHHMIRRQHFETMQENALFVNIARGKMVNEQEMVEVVQKKNIMLALDVFEEEPLAADSPLRANDRVFLAPHRANAPIEFEQRWQYIADELERFYRGERPHTALSVERAKAMSES